MMTREFGPAGRPRPAAGVRPAHHARARRRHRRPRCPLPRRRPLLDRLVDLDPELLLPYVTLRLGGVQRSPSPAQPRPASGAGDGSVRGDPPRPAGGGIELIARGFAAAATPSAIRRSTRRASWRAPSTDTSSHERRVADPRAAHAGARAPGRRRDRRPWSSSRRRHRRRRRARRRRARPVASPSSSSRPRLRHEPLELQARARRAALPRLTARSGSRTRARASAAS